PRSTNSCLTAFVSTPVAPGLPSISTDSKMTVGRYRRRSVGQPRSNLQLVPLDVELDGQRLRKAAVACGDLRRVGQRIEPRAHRRPPGRCLRETSPGIATLESRHTIHIAGSDLQDDKISQAIGDSSV